MSSPADDVPVIPGDGSVTSGDDAVSIDRVTAIRRRILPLLHRAKAPLGGYAQCIIDPAEYVGTVRNDVGSVRESLRQMSFTPEPVASLKCHRDGRLSAGSWVRRRSLTADRQLHATLFLEASDAVEVFAHREYSWLTHPIKHYTADGWDTSGGVERMRALFDRHDVPYRIERPERRPRR